MSCEPCSVTKALSPSRTEAGAALRTAAPEPGGWRGSCEMLVPRYLYGLGCPCSPLATWCGNSGPQVGCQESRASAAGGELLSEVQVPRDSETFETWLERSHLQLLLNLFGRAQLQSMVRKVNQVLSSSSDGMAEDLFVVVTLLSGAPVAEFTAVTTSTAPRCGGITSNVMVLRCFK